MDFKKAFDYVLHDALLSKLHAMGISGKLWTWLAIETCLKTRVQCVRIGDEYLDLCRVLSGVVSQGRILGPLLFGIFINDLQFTQPHTYMQMTQSV